MSSHWFAAPRTLDGTVPNSVRPRPVRENHFNERTVKLGKEPRTVRRTPSAYSYPLIIKQLLHTPILYSPEQETVYSDKVKFTYRDFYQRVNRHASALAALGVGPGDTVAVLDWDSHRYLECFFAVPMMGAILHTVNVRLSPEQILFTMNHAEDKAVLLHEDFLKIVEGLSDRLETVENYVLLQDGDQAPSTSLPIAGEYEALLKETGDSYDFPDFDENTWATTFYTTGTTGDPKGVYFSHRQLVMHTLAVATAVSGFTVPARFQSADVYMPITPVSCSRMGVPLCSYTPWNQTGLSR